MIIDTFSKRGVIRGTLLAVYLLLIVVFMGSILADPAQAVNSVATGKPVITGTVQVGETLTADTSGISDTDGLAGAVFTYQWVRIDGSDEADIPAATDSTYTLISDDLGKTLKAEVSFTDDGSYAEGPLPSDPTDVVSGVVLVSNINQSLDTSGEWINDTFFLAHQFTTGSNLNGYDVAELILKVQMISDNFTPAISLYTSTGDDLPDQKFCEFVEVTPADNDPAFNVPGEHSLKPDTKYFLYVAGEDGTDPFKISLGTSDDTGLDSSSLPGWNSSDSKLKSDDSGQNWSSSDGFLPRYSVVGAPRSTHPGGSPPVFSGNPAFQVSENVMSVGAIGAYDVDPEDNITGYSISGGDDASLFAITNAGFLSFLSAPDFETPLDSNRNSYYVLEVNATSGSGSRTLSSQKEILVVVTNANEPPSRPEAPTLSKPTSTSLLVEWSAPHNTGPVITDYDVEYRQGDTGPFTDWPHTGKSTSTTLTGLNASTLYEVQVLARNADGDSEWSPIANSTHVPTLVNSPPVFSSKTHFLIEENTFTVNTVVASDDDAEDSVTGYSVHSSYDGARFAITNSGVLSFVLAPDFENPSDSGRNNRYLLEVNATSGSGSRILSSSQLIIVEIRDVDERPSTPGFPVLSSPTNTSLFVSWTQPENTGPAITDYDVQYREDGTDTFINWTHTDSTTSTTITGLSQNTDYEVRVRASNDEGTSEWSDVASATTGVVMNNHPIFSSNATFSVRENQLNAGVVTASDPDTQDSVTGYSISGGADASLFEITSGGALSFVSAPDFETPADDDGNNDYVLEITATSGSGSREMSATQTVTIKVTNVDETGSNKPPVFSSIPVFSVSENGLSVDTIVASDDDAEDSVTGYSISGGADASLFEINSLTGALSFKSAPDFENPQDSNQNNAYLLEVNATSGSGSRILSSKQLIIVRVADVDEKPSAPSAPVLSFLSSTSLFVNWSEPDTTGPAVTDYEVEYRNKGNLTFLNWSHDDASTSTAITGLSENTDYEVRVRARNDEGIGDWSSVVSIAAVIIRPPPSISQVVESEVTRTGAGVNVTVDNHGGFSTRVYLRYSSVSSSGPWSQTLDEDTSTGTAVFALAGLNPDTDYYVQASLHDTFPAEGLGSITFTTQSLPDGLFLISPSEGNYTGNLLFNASYIGTDVQSLEFGYRKPGDANFTWLPGTNDTGSFWSTSLDTRTVDDGLYDVTVRNTGLDNTLYLCMDFHRVIIDNSAPTFSIISPAAGRISGVVLFNASVTDASSGVKSVEFGRRPSGSAEVAWFEGIKGTGNFWSTEMDTIGLSDGSYYLAMRVTDSAGNENVDTNVFTFVVDNIPDGTSPRSRSSGGGGGGGGGSSRSINVCSSVQDVAGNVSQSRSWNRIENGSAVEFTVSNQEIPVSLVNFNVSETVTNAGVIVSTSSVLPSGFSADYDGILYRYFDVNACNLAESIVSALSFSFSVNMSFVSENNGSADDVVLLRHDNGQWVETNVLFRGSDALNYFYEVEPEGFFAYAIVLRKSSGDGPGGSDVTPGTDVGTDVGTGNQNVSDQPDNESVTGQSKITSGSGIGAYIQSYGQPRPLGFYDFLFFVGLFIFTFAGIFWFLTKKRGPFSSGVTLKVLFVGSLFVLLGLSLFWFLTETPSSGDIAIFDVLFLIVLFVITFAAVFWLLVRKEKRQKFSFP